MKAFIQTLLLSLQLNAMQNRLVSKDIGMRNFMAWIILFMRTCKKEKMILQKNNGIILKRSMKFILLILKSPMPLLLFRHVTYLKTGYGKKLLHKKYSPQILHGKSFRGKKLLLILPGFSVLFILVKLIRRGLS